MWPCKSLLEVFIILPISHNTLTIYVICSSRHEKEKQGKDVHIPYRNSMMTSVLRDSLGGNCKTIMVATISPESQYTDESISTCNFAQRVKCVKNTASVNEEIEPELVIQRLKADVRRLKEEVEFLSGNKNEDDEGCSSEMEEEDIDELTKSIERYIQDREEHAHLDLGYTLQMMPYNTSPYRGKHIVVFGHNFKTGINTGMAKRFAKIVEAFLKMGVTIHYICQECVESSVGQFTEDWFNVQAFGYIMNVYPGSTTQDQVDSMLAHGDDCLPDKIVAVLSFVTHLGMNIQRHYNKLKKKKVTKEQQLKWESMDFDDGIEHEALVESMKSRGVSLPVIIVSDDVHWDRNAVGYNMKEDNKPQHEIDKIKQCK